MVQNAESGEPEQKESKDVAAEDSKLPAKETSKDTGESPKETTENKESIQEVSGTISSYKVLPKELDYDKLSSNFLYCPKIIIKRTLENTNAKGA